MIFYTRLYSEYNGVLTYYKDQSDAYKHMQQLAKAYDTQIRDCLPYELAKENGMITGKEKNNAVR